jgi:hypothetical protein
VRQLTSETECETKKSRRKFCVGPNVKRGLLPWFGLLHTAETEKKYKPRTKSVLHTLKTQTPFRTPPKYKPRTKQVASSVVPCGHMFAVLRYRITTCRRGRRRLSTMAGSARPFSRGGGGGRDRNTPTRGLAVPRGQQSDARPVEPRRPPRSRRSIDDATGRHHPPSRPPSITQPNNAMRGRSSLLYATATPNEPRPFHLTPPTSSFARDVTPHAEGESTRKGIPLKKMPIDGLPIANCCWFRPKERDGR